MRRKSNGAAFTVENPGSDGAVGEGRRSSGHGGLGRTGYAVLGFSEPVQRHLGVSCPQLMRVNCSKGFDDHDLSVHENTVGYQIDIAFEIACEFPFVGEDITAASVSKAIAGVYPALVALDGYRHASSAPTKIEHAEIVVERVPIESMNLSGDFDVRAVVQREGRTVWDVTSMLVRPLRALLWTAERLQEQGSRLGKGDIVASGTYPFLLDIQPGDRLFMDVVGRAGISHKFRNDI
jgi:hypothetical protein